MSTPTPVVMWSAKIAARADGCWVWTGRVRSDGYAQTTRRGISDYVHRHAWLMAHGVIADGMVIDHLCRVRHCCNPAHLELVTQAVNVRRGRLPGLTALRNASRAAAQTHCRHGHAYEPDNTGRNSAGSRFCLICNRANQQRYTRKVRSRVDS